MPPISISILSPGFMDTGGMPMAITSPCMMTLGNAYRMRACWHRPCQT